MLLRGLFQSMNNLTDEHTALPSLDRRGFLKAAAATAAVSAGVITAPAIAKASGERCLSVFCPNTGETMRVIYWTPTDGYISESIAEISYAMRDRHNNLVKRIDSRLLDQMYSLQQKVRPRQPMHILCGYRSPQTNARLRRIKRGVAKESYHMKGMAVDIRVPDRDYNTIHRAALSLHSGGVGRYRRARFVHLDSGPVRHWG